MIRKAKAQDIPTLLALLKQAQDHEEGRYHDFEIDEAYFKALAFEAIRSGNMFLSVIDRGKGAVGFLMGAAERLYLVGKVRYATDLFFVCDKATRKEMQALLNAFETWAETLPDVVEIWLGITTASRASWRVLGRFYEQHGYAQEGAVYQRRLSKCQA